MTRQDLPDQYFLAFHRKADGRFYGVIFLQHYVSRIVTGRLRPEEPSSAVTGYDDVW